MAIQMFVIYINKLNFKDYFKSIRLNFTHQMMNKISMKYQFFLE